jgi:type IV secretion system protein VirD4
MFAMTNADNELSMFAMTNADDGNAVVFIILAISICVWWLYSQRWRPTGTAFGQATWASDKLLRAWWMLGNVGLILGRTLSGVMIRMPRYCHILLIGGTGSGKGIGIIIPNLLTYFRGSLVVFDTKGDLYTATTEKRRKRRGQRIFRLAPFNGGSDKLNPLDTIPVDSPLLCDHARAMAESLVVRLGTEPDGHWNDKAVQVITALLVFVLRRLWDSERNLNSVQDIASDPMMVAAVADKLQEMGGIPARMGAGIKSLFEKPGLLSKEGSGVFSTVARHLSFLDSEMVATSVESSTFDVRCLLEPGVTLYLQIPPDQLEAQRGLLRCWVSTLIRVIGSSGSEETSEVLLILDEASALGSLSAVEEALVRGRSAGVRMLLAYQSDSQVRTAFKDKPTLIYDNCGTQIHMGPASSFEAAERLSKSLGDWTQVVDSYGENSSRSSNTNGDNSGSMSRGHSMNYAQQGRALLRPEEILRLSEECILAFIRGMPAPILAQRIKWYEDRDFNPAAKKGPQRRRISTSWLVWWMAVIVLGLLAIRAKVEGYGYWQPETQQRR